MMASKNWEKSKYFGMTKSEIKKQWKDNGSEAALLGTTMHYLFEYHYNDMYNTPLCEHPQYFQNIPISPKEWAKDKKTTQNLPQSIQTVPEVDWG